MLNLAKVDVAGDGSWQQFGSRLLKPPGEAAAVPLSDTSGCPLLQPGRRASTPDDVPASQDSLISDADAAGPSGGDGRGGGRGRSRTPKSQASRLLAKQQLLRDSTEAVKFPGGWLDTRGEDAHPQGLCGASGF